MRSSAANMDATLIYKATDTLQAYTGFALKMHEIRIPILLSAMGILAMATYFILPSSYGIVKVGALCVKERRGAF